MFSKLFMAAVLLWSASLASCSSSPKSHEAEVGAPVSAGEETWTGTRYRIDLNASSLQWTGAKPTGRHTGTIPLISGKLRVKDEMIMNGSFEFDLTGLDISDLEGHRKEKLYNHLQSDDFFATAQYPSAFFELVDLGIWREDSVSGLDPEFALTEPTHEVLGNLTLRGKKLGITFPAAIEISDSLLTARAQFNIDRTRWGVSYHSESSLDQIAKDNLIDDRVNINLLIIGKPEFE
jgi:polyisoprenoid-binding protein YceI